MTDKRYLPEGGLFGTPQNTEYISSREMLERAMREGRILEALAVKCDCTEMTLTVDLGGMNGYIKRDSAAYSPRRGGDQGYRGDNAGRTRGCVYRDGIFHRRRRADGSDAVARAGAEEVL